MPEALTGKREVLWCKTYQLIKVSSFHLTFGLFGFIWREKSLERTNLRCSFLQKFLCKWFRKSYEASIPESGYRSDSREEIQNLQPSECFMFNWHELDPKSEVAFCSTCFVTWLFSSNKVKGLDDKLLFQWFLESYFWSPCLVLVVPINNHSMEASRKLYSHGQFEKDCLQRKELPFQTSFPDSSTFTKSSQVLLISPSHTNDTQKHHP